jgi:chromosome partitioning protein
MPVITVASPKGGAGKSTAAVILGTELAHAGAEVTILDCDPNHSITIWAERGKIPPRITVRSDVGESEIVRTIKQQDADGRIIIVDLEGVASRLVSRAISQADLVLTPMRATTLDATIGVRALALIEEEEEALGTPIKHAVVFTMTASLTQRYVKRHGHNRKGAELRHLCRFSPPPFGLAISGRFLGVECRPNPEAFHRRSRTPRSG